MLLPHNMGEGTKRCQLPLTTKVRVRNDIPFGDP